MPQRAPLLVKLGDGPLRLDLPQGGSRWYFLAGGFAQMKGDHLSLLTGEAMPAEEISRQDAEASLREAEARAAVTDDEFARRQRDLARARTLLQITGNRG